MKPPAPSRPERLATAGPRAARWIVGGLFLWAGLVKVAAPAAFFGALLGYELPLAEPLLRLAAIALPWLEVITGAALLIDVWPETVRPLAAALCGVFFIALAQACMRGLDVSCGCFGAAGADRWIDRPCVAVVRTLALLAAALYALPGSAACERDRQIPNPNASNLR